MNWRAGFISNKEVGYMTVQMIQSGRDGNQRNSQMAVRPITVRRNRENGQKESVSYQQFFEKAMTAYQN